MTPTQDPIRVMIVDDHAVVRSGLAAFLSVYDDLELVAQAASGNEALRLSQQVVIDVVLMDLLMPEMDGATATRLLLEQCPHLQIVALTSFRETELVEGALRAGAISYLLKDVTADELARAIREAHAGRPTLATEAAQALIRATRQPSSPGHDLTPREKDVLAQLVRGLTNEEIAHELVVSPSTVKFHVSSILGKLGVTTRTEAAALAMRHRLVEDNF